MDVEYVKLDFFVVVSTCHLEIRVYKIRNKYNFFEVTIPLFARNFISSLFSHCHIVTLLHYLKMKQM